MSFWQQGKGVSEFEGKDSRETYTRMQKRVLLTGVYSTKHCLLMMLAGLFFAVALTGFEFALRNPEVEGLLVTLFQGGFWVSLFGVLLIPYGLYHLIKAFRI